METAKCINFEVCGNTFRCELGEENVRGFCELCEDNLSEFKDLNGLEFIDGIECCICLDENNKRGVKLSRCNHSICIKCYKEIWKSIFSPDSYNLPVEKIETATGGTYYEALWPNEIPRELIPLMAIRMKMKGIQVEETEYEKINKFWKEALNDKKRHEEKNLRKCPLCRQ